MPSPPNCVRWWPFDTIGISQFSGETEKLWRLRGVDREVPGHVPLDTPSRWVYNHQEPLVIPYLKDEIRFDEVIARSCQELQSLCILPLTTVHRRIGSISLGSKAADAYSREE